MEKVLVKLKDRSYPIYLTREALDDVGSVLRRMDRLEKVVIITDSRVAEMYLESVKRGFHAAGYQVDSIVIPAGEESKSINQVVQIYDRLLDLEVDRKGILAALGGGVVGDITGFVAATYLRGVDYVQIPTTLVAQVDSAIGGKTGVNLSQGKNLVGAFWHPRLVFSDVGVLKTLDQREFIAGLAEVIKYGIIMDSSLFKYLEENADKILSKKEESLYYIVKRCARNKALVVEEDEREESGRRSILNFGHTIGHALEASTNYQGYLHGEAVAIGMVFASKISKNLGFCSNGAVDRIHQLIERYGLPHEQPDLNEDDFDPIIRVDKKMTKGRINFVFVEDIGKVKLEKIDIRDLLIH